MFVQHEPQRYGGPAPKSHVMKARLLEEFPDATCLLKELARQGMPGVPIRDEIQSRAEVMVQELCQMIMNWNMVVSIVTRERLGREVPACFARIDNERLQRDLRDVVEVLCR